MSVTQLPPATNCALSPFAAVSKQCQTHAEPIIFSPLRIRDSEIPDFSLIVNQTRFRVLRSLEYHSDAATRDEPGLRISEESRTTQNSIFIVALETLLAALKDKSGGAAESLPGLHMSLGGKGLGKAVYLSQDVEAGNHEVELRRAWVDFTKDGLPDSCLVPIVTSFSNEEFHTTVYLPRCRRDRGLL